MQVPTNTDMYTLSTDRQAKRFVAGSYRCQYRPNPNSIAALLRSGSSQSAKHPVPGASCRYALLELAN